MENIWLQLVITVGGVVTAGFVTIRYATAQAARREKAILENNRIMQQMQLEYYETKNGHMERMSKDFTKASNMMSKAINKLSTEIKVLSSAQK